MTTSIDFATIISAATVAFAVSALILLLSNLWASFSSRFKFRKGFRGRILFEAGEELRRQVRRRDALCYRHIIAMLVFSVCFLTILVLGRRDWWAELPVGIWMVLGAALVGAMVYYLREFLLMVRSRARLAYLRDANIALGHGLLHSTVKGNRVFHSIPVGGDIVDNVVIGANGVYAVNVIVPPKHSAKTVQLKKDKLFFEPGNDSVSLVEHHNKIKSLARELTPVVGHPVKVLSVIGVPGCQVITTGSDKHLVVNERMNVSSGIATKTRANGKMKPIPICAAVVIHINSFWTTPSPSPLSSALVVITWHPGTPITDRTLTG